MVNLKDFEEFSRVSPEYLKNSYRSRLAEISSRLNTDNKNEEESSLVRQEIAKETIFEVSELTAKSEEMDELSEQLKFASNKKSKHFEAEDKYIPV